MTATSLDEVEAALQLSYTPSETQGREAEEVEIGGFLEACVEERRGGSLYVCGGPGTGKTLHVERARQRLEESSSSARTWSTRGTAYASGAAFCRALARAVAPAAVVKRLDLESMTATEALDAVETALSGTKRGHRKAVEVVIVDEVDALVAAAAGVARRLFELANTPELRLCVCGIANAMDLPQSAGLDPSKVVVFQPYGFQSLEAILRERCGGRLSEAFFHPKALELCARKAAARAGDARRALDVALLALRTVRARENGNTPVVSLRDVLDAFADGATSSLTLSLEGLPPHARLVLKAAAKLAATQSTFTHRQLLAAYVAACPGGERDEAAHDALGLLDASGLIRPADTSRRSLLSTGKRKRKTSLHQWKQPLAPGSDAFAIAVDLADLKDAFAALG